MILNYSLQTVLYLYNIVYMTNTGAVQVIKITLPQKQLKYTGQTRYMMIRHMLLCNIILAN